MRSLRSSRDIRAIRSAQRGAVSERMVLRALPRVDGQAGIRVAVIAGRSVGKAVARNRAKRRLRAAARQATIPDGTDLVIVARPPATSAPFQSLIGDLEQLARRALREARHAEVIR